MQCLSYGRAYPNTLIYFFSVTVVRVARKKTGRVEWEFYQEDLRIEPMDLQ